MNNENNINELKYKKSKRKIILISIIILVIGVLIGGFLIYTGVSKQLKVNQKYSEESKEELLKKIDTEKENLKSKKEELTKTREDNIKVEKEKLETKKKELEEKGLKYDVFADYDDGEKYDLKIITEVLDPSFKRCTFDSHRNNKLTSSYCALDNKTDQEAKDIIIINNVLQENFNYCSFNEYLHNSITNKYCSYIKEYDELKTSSKGLEVAKSIPYYVFGGIIILVAAIISVVIYLIAKRREIMAFSAQQVKPIIEEGMKLHEKIKLENLPTHCPHCGAPTNKKIVCEYCGAKIIK